MKKLFLTILFVCALSNAMDEYVGKHGNELKKSLKEIETSKNKSSQYDFTCNILGLGSCIDQQTKSICVHYDTHLQNSRLKKLCVNEGKVILDNVKIEKIIAPTIQLDQGELQTLGIIKGEANLKNSAVSKLLEVYSLQEDIKFTTQNCQLNESYIRADVSNISAQLNKTNWAKYLCLATNQKIDLSLTNSTNKKNGDIWVQANRAEIELKNSSIKNLYLEGLSSDEVVPRFTLKLLAGSVIKKLRCINIPELHFECDEGTKIRKKHLDKTAIIRI